MIGHGISGLIERLSCGHVRKVPYPPGQDKFLPSPDSDDYNFKWRCNDIAREHEIYTRIGRHPYILPVVDYCPKQGILVLPEVHGKTLKKYLVDHQVEFKQLREWSIALMTTVAMLHRFGIIHADINTNNTMVDKKTCEFFLIDFAGSKIDGKRELVITNSSHYRAKKYSDPLGVKADLFALGSTLYEIFTTHKPYEDIEDDEATRLYESGCFPSVDGLPYGDAILACWKEEYSTADEVPFDLTRKYDSGS